ncbi:MAG: L-2-hydroxyglutarate oxidase [Actinomycetota bacterium]|nr:L-2-hydroxyglutarate oxidase [Actinomycetota bacterium]
MSRADCDLAVVGAGIVGLAVACELKRRRPSLEVTVLEREDHVATHQTARNSGVVHAGIYYAPGSLKARLCVEGAHALYELCERAGVAHERCGKVIVARDATELGRLDELERRGLANGVPGLRRLDALGIEKLESHCRGVAGLHSPSTGIVDFAGVARALAEELRRADGAVTTGARVEEVSTGGRRIALRHGLGETRARFAVFCAGGWSDRLAVAAGAPEDPRIVPFRGAYLRLVHERRHLVRSLVYPVPDPSLPFLGVHLTRRVDGDVLLGPTALVAGARDAYSLSRVSWEDVGATLRWPGSWRMFARWWRTGVSQMRYATSRPSLVREAASYVPDLRLADVEPAFAGVRAQAVARDGTLVEDFAFSHTERALHVRNAPSPAATSSLAIARVVADRVEPELAH